jgi:hypothetical protein
VDCWFVMDSFSAMRRAKPSAAAVEDVDAFRLCYPSLPLQVDLAGPVTDTNRILCMESANISSRLER